ncbi:MAG: acetyl-CoA carboxylase biotin carboxylase subunit, partial [Alphaproteobacteria bacterium]|nr:acetyl-CoA carboxylase biotin carboxylase subunit [Alphaproteobacteria bacterium]
MPQIKKVLIANRGEIALRIIRACRDMGIRTVAVYSTADRDAMHVQLADESVCIGPAPARDSYLNESAILTAALLANADAIHPGYGFLSERADFARKVEQHGMIWIGPSPDMIEKMGDKVNAKRTAIECGLPVVPGSDGAIDTLDDALTWAEKIGYPVMLKASAGGGGRGMRAVMSQADMAEAFQLTKNEAKSSFGDDTLYMEKLLMHPRHIEFQVLGDKHGNVVIFGERDCSLQRRNQKVMEECPASVLTAKQRDDMIEICKNAGKKMGYTNAGTFEFMFEDGKFYFLEMNTRLQVEHPVTEMVYGVDLVREQIRIASGEKLGYTQSNVIPNGHAIEFRINAEDPDTFIPNPGTITMYAPSGGLGVRVDSAVYTGYTIPATYDS